MIDEELEWEKREAEIMQDYGEWLKPEIKVALDEGATLPTKAHPSDAGMDIYSLETKSIPPRGYETFKTGVHIQIPEGYCGLLVSKSGLNVNHNITSTGLIDSGYTGEIKVKLYNHGFQDFKVERGNRISQLVLLPILVANLEVVSELDESERGDKGFGSSGK